MAVKLIYKDIPQGITTDAEVSTSGYSDFSAPDLLPLGAYTGAVATLEHNAWGLSSDYKTKGTQRFALWSEALSNNEGVFDTPLIVTVDFSAQYTATGLTILFSPDANEYSSKIAVIWYQGEEVKHSDYYYPTTGHFTLNQVVEAFDRVVIAFYETSQPNRRLKIEQILFGVLREFSSKELTSTSFIHEISLISDTVPINVMDANIHSGTDAEFIFQKKQPVEAYNGDELIGVYYIESGERTGASTYSISCQDAIGLLEKDAVFPGKIWEEDTPVIDIINEVLGGTYTVELDEGLSAMTLQGAIRESTKREALQQIAFALGACIDTSGSWNIKMFLPPKSTGAEIPAEETYTGGAVSMQDAVTEVTVTGYKIYLDYAEEGDDYVEEKGRKFKAERTVATARNPNVTVGMPENKIVIDDCLLISRGKAQEKANALLSYFMRRNKYSFTHVLKGQKMADRAVAHLPWGGTVGGNITKMTIKVSGLTVSDTEFLTD